MDNQFTRTQSLIGKRALNKLSSSKVIIFGLGGVGGYVAEALARCGVGKLCLVDNDTINVTNLNRQIIATHETIGEYKADAMKKRVLSINPAAEVEAVKCFYLPETADKFDFTEYDYVIDAVDTVTAKIEIATRAISCGTPVISCMGTGNKLNPAALQVADIFETSVCPLARVMRRELKKRGVKSLKVVYSREEPVLPLQQDSVLNGEKPEDNLKKAVPASVPFVPAAAGLLIAAEAVRDLIKNL